jgi:hypothetical protein
VLNDIPSNHRSRGDINSTGTRLSVAVLQQIFQWTKVARTAVALKVDHYEAPPHGLYLTFPHHYRYGHGKLQLGKDPKEVYMEFDVIPGESSSLPSLRQVTRTPRYIFSLHWRYTITFPRNLWLNWDISTGTVQLSEKIEPSCFVDMTYDSDKTCRTFRLVVEAPSKGRMMVKFCLDPSQAENIDVNSSLTTADMSFIKAEQSREKVLIIE